MELSEDFTNQLYQNFAGNAKYRVIENAASKNGLLNALETRQSHAAHPFTFDIDLTSSPVTNQKQSGRCWLFATLNLLNFQLAKNQKLEKFEFSESYLYFWDKYEKANWFFTKLLENEQATADLNEAHFRYFFDYPQDDGGHWDTAVALIEKYGLVPKSVFPETVDSSDSKDLNYFLNKLLRQDAEKLLTAKNAGQATEPIQKKALQEIFNFLAAQLGLPIKQFDYAFKDAENQITERFSGSPLEFYQKYISLKLEDFVSVVSLPLADHPFNRSMTTSFGGNVVGGHAFKHLNLPQNRLNELALAQLKEGLPVFFGCDVAQESNLEAGLLTLDSYAFKTALDIEFTQERSARLLYRDGNISHAMLLVGVAFDENQQVTNWKVENSWGKDKGDKGYFVASDDWMLAHSYQVVVNKKYLTAAEQAAFEAEALVYDPWDLIW